MKIRTKILSLGILPLIFAIIAVNTTVYWLNASRIETQQAELRAKLMTVDILLAVNDEDSYCD